MNKAEKLIKVIEERGHWRQDPNDKNLWIFKGSEGKYKILPRVKVVSNGEWVEYYPANSEEAVGRVSVDDVMMDWDFEDHDQAIYQAILDAQDKALGSPEE